MATPIGTLPAAERSAFECPGCDEIARDSANRIAEFFAGARRGRASADSDNRGGDQR